MRLVKVLVLAKIKLENLMTDKSITVKVKIFESIYKELYAEINETPLRLRAEKLRKYCVIGYSDRVDIPSKFEGYTKKIPSSDLIINVGEINSSELTKGMFDDFENDE